MFSDISGTWDGVLEDMSDVKELVIYLYSVKLPPWADSPVDFIHKHHMALESEHVQRRATQDQIAYFGQTPSQLLTIPHLKKRPLADVLHLQVLTSFAFYSKHFCSFSQTIYRNPNGIRPYVIPNPDRCNIPADAIFASPDSVVVVDTNAPAAHVALHKWQPNTPDGHGTPFLFQHGKAAASSTGGALMRMFKGPGPSGTDDWQYPRASAFPGSGVQSSAIVAITCDKEIITGGYSLTFA
ncbi:hypothetical protein GW17_00017948 [Ensete ventricosum]|nr:hypothetical protein GW17_00017948 [Ensete ventricosum]